MLAALESGVNVFDSAINYRCQRSERALGRALGRAFADGLAARDEVVVSTKAGFLPFEEELPPDPDAYHRERWLGAGLVSEEDAAAGHSLAPAFLGDQLERSRANLGLETVDLFYLHNPEARLHRAGGRSAIDNALGWAAETLAADRIGAAGLATWNGLRTPPGGPDHLPLAELVTDASPISAIQLPVNLAMPEALAAPTQELEGAVLPALVVARHAGLTVFASASLLQGRLTRGLPTEITQIFPGLTTDAQRALQFTRSVPAVTTALVGMSNPTHVAENLELAHHEPAAPESLQMLFAGGVGG